MKAEHPSYAEELWSLMNHRQAAKIHEALGGAIEYIWDKTPKTKPKEVLSEITSETYCSRRIGLTRKSLEDVTYLRVTKPYNLQSQQRNDYLFLPQITITLPDSEFDEEYLILPSGFIIPFNPGHPVAQVPAPLALSIYGFLIDVRIRLENWDY